MAQKDKTANGDPTKKGGVCLSKRKGVKINNQKDISRARSACMHGQKCMLKEGFSCTKQALHTCHTTLVRKVSIVHSLLESREFLIA